MERKGIDISRYQGNPDFSKVKQDVDFVIAQIGYGRYTFQKDATFGRNYSECKNHNIPFGGYWYSYAKSTADALAEAQACIEVIKNKKFEYPIYYDLEENLGALGRSLVSSIATTFCTALEKAGYFAGIYISRAPAQSYLTDEVCKKYALWLAEYNSQLNWNGSPVGIWQYSSSGRISGIDGNVDMNICYVDYPGLIKNAGLNGFTKPESLKSLDETGFKRGDKSLGVYYLKQRLKALGYKVDDTQGFGEGTEKAVNKQLELFGYKPNGIAGENFAKLVMK